jgi:hypothetical protein
VKLWGAKEPKPTVTARAKPTEQQVHAEMLRLVAVAIERNQPEMLRETADRLEKIE